MPALVKASPVPRAVPSQPPPAPPPIKKCSLSIANEEDGIDKAGMLKGASFENMSGGGGGKALSFLINTKPKNTVLVQSTPLVLRSITRHKGYVKGDGVLSYKDVVPIAGVIGDGGVDRKSTRLNSSH